MLVSNKAKEFLKGFEGLQLKAYKCPAGVWTIGYGSTGSHVKAGMTVTKEQADVLLNKDIAPREDKLTRILGRTPTTQNQFDALFLLAYNIGMGAFEKSTLLRLHRNAEYEEAANEFLKWNKAGGKVLNGLSNRRKIERSLYIGQG